ncbi:MAG: thioredoxin [Ilumatobacteraceae bacterium]
MADAEFREAVDTDQLVLVDLWAAWCGPCRMVAPVLEKLARNFVGDLKVVKVDVDANPMIARSFQASSIPMLVFLRSGKLLETVVGAQPEHVLTDKVRHHLAAV